MEKFHIIHAVSVEQLRKETSKEFSIALSWANVKTDEKEMIVSLQSFDRFEWNDAFEDIKEGLSVTIGFEIEWQIESSSVDLQFNFRHVK